MPVFANWKEQEHKVKPQVCRQHESIIVFTAPFTSSEFVKWFVVSPAHTELREETDLWQECKRNYPSSAAAWNSGFLFLLYRSKGKRWQRKLLLRFLVTDLHCQVATSLQGLMTNTKQESNVDDWDPLQGYKCAVKIRIFCIWDDLTGLWSLEIAS